MQNFGLFKPENNEMLTIPTAALRLRRELTAAEKSADDLLLHLASIQATIVSARNETDVPMNTGQEAIIRLQRSIGQAVGAQTDLFRVHECLANIGRELMMGDEPYCPPSTGLDDTGDKIVKFAA